MNYSDTLGNGRFQRRSNCRGCLSDNLVSFLDYGSVPLAGDFITPDQVGSELTYPMDLSYCTDCSLVQITNVVSAEELFTDYRYLSSVTSTLMGHFNSYAQTLKNRFFHGKDGLVVEFGCNDGVLLKPLKELGIRAIGIDAAENVVEITRRKGLDARHGYFGHALAQELVEASGQAQVITASNVFAHIDNLDNVLRGVDTLLAEDGTFIVEVHYLRDLVESVQFDTVYHEHLCYYSLRSLNHLFGRFGLEIVDAERLPMHGGSIRVYGSRQAFAPGKCSERLARLTEEEEAAGLHSLETFEVFGEASRRQRLEIRDMVLSRKAVGRTVCGYGAAGRATTLLNYCGIGHETLDYIVDESPSRIGRYVPGVRVPVVNRDHFHANPVDDCLLTAWNYRDEIIAKEPTFTAKGGVFLAPLPKQEIIQGLPCFANAS